MSVLQQCCGCGDRRSELRLQDAAGLAVERGLAYIGRGRWLCATCTRTANAEFALAAGETYRKVKSPVVESETPPPGFA